MRYSHFSLIAFVSYALLSLLIEFSYLPIGGLLFLVLGWALASERKQVFFGALGFYGAMARDIPLAYSGFTDNGILIGVIYYLASVLILASVWAALWARSHKVIRLFAILTLLIIPPIGLIGWAHPLLAAGSLANFGVLGLMLTFCAMLLVVSDKEHSRHLGLVILIVCSISTLLIKPSISDFRVDSVNTEYGKVDAANFVALYGVNADLHTTARRAILPNTLVVTPESLVGVWNKATEAFWASLFKEYALYNATLVLGGLDYSYRLQNIAIYGGAKNGIYYQHIPVPIILYNPLDRASYPLDLFPPLPEHIHTITLICYEQLVLWPALRQILNGKRQAVVALSNHWFTQRLSFERWQRLQSTAIARIMRVPLAYAINK